MLDWTPIISTALVALITSGATLLGVIAKIAATAIQSNATLFTIYLKQQADLDRQERERERQERERERERDRQEREQLRQTLQEHTDISKEISQNQAEHTRAITLLTAQIARLVDRGERAEDRRNQ